MGNPTHTDKGYRTEVGATNYNPILRDRMTLREENDVLFMAIVRCWEYLSGSPKVTYAEVEQKTRAILEHYGRKLNTPDEDNLTVKRRKEAVKDKRPRARNTAPGSVERFYFKIASYYSKNKIRKALTTKELEARLRDRGILKAYTAHKPVPTAMQKYNKKYGRFEVGKQLVNGVWMNTYKLVPLRKK